MINYLSNTSKILQYNIYNKDLNSLLKYLEEDDSKHFIISGNPEVLYNGFKDSYLKKAFKNGVIIPDGIGTIIASKILNVKLQSKIAGIEVFNGLLKRADKTSERVYLLGGEEEIILKCSENLKKKYKNLNIVGFHNGYFDLNNCDSLINEISSLSPDMIFVAMGVPRQEYFILKCMDKINSKIFMGVGGSFDVEAGKVNRAPKWMIDFGIEWLYRVSKEPFRIKRLGSIFKFLKLVIVERLEK